MDENEDMLRNYSVRGRLLGLGSSSVVYRPEQQAGASMQTQVSECLGQASCVPQALPPTQLRPCPARKGEADPGYARNAAGSSVQAGGKGSLLPREWAEGLLPE